MKEIRRLLAKMVCFMNDQRGVTTAEYALLLALVVVVLIGALTGLGGALQQKISELTGTLQGAH